jgi:uncharacterized repeat protein (TIGR03843 family)
MLPMARKRRRRHEVARREPPMPDQPVTPSDGVLSLSEACDLLEQATILECKGLPWGSNYTFAVGLDAGDGRQVLGIYKPRRGEVPLWDFPDGTLYRRERAAYLTSVVLDWRFVPPTVIRDGPYGIGSVQLYIDPDPRASFELFRAVHADELRRIAAFDFLTNNADRKGAHFLLGRQDGQIWGIDHGLCFNAAPKLRTVIWDYCGEPIPEPLLADIRALRADSLRLKTLFDQLEPLLLPEELEALLHRFDLIVERGEYPSPRSHRSYPWPSW